MTALSVIAVAIVGLLGLRNRDIAISSRAAHIVEATLLARQKMTEFRLLEKTDTSEQKGDFGEQAPGYQWELQVNKETLHPKIHEVIFRVLWKDQGRDETVTLTKYLIVDQ